MTDEKPAGTGAAGEVDAGTPPAADGAEANQRFLQLLEGKSVPLWRLLEQQARKREAKERYARLRASLERYGIQIDDDDTQDHRRQRT